jgi:hypothetical protein
MCRQRYRRFAHKENQEKSKNKKKLQRNLKLFLLVAEAFNYLTRLSWIITIL